MYRLSPEGFVRSDGVATRTIRVPEGGLAGAEWHWRQDQAVPGYLHEIEAVPPDMQHLYSLFSWYIATALLEGHCKRILDIGCGIGANLPPYVRPLGSSLASRGIEYVGLDPIDQNVSGRAYPFVCGRIEDLPSVLEGEFDLFLFATSLDHLEDTARAANAVRRLSAPRALGLFWFGLHDPSVVAEELGRKWFGRLYSSLNPLAVLVRAALVVAVMARRYPDMIQRAWRLRRGLPMDKFHFSYFTRSNVRSHLEHFGEVRDLTHVTGTNSSFATVDIRGDRSRQA
jgi:SAM-dependent methyltransferase